MNPRRRARLNLLIFWLVVIGLPTLLVYGCVVSFTPCCVDPPRPAATL